MFSQPEFQKWGKSDVILFASVATNIRGRKDDRLISKYGFGGFPSFALLDAQGKIIQRGLDRDLIAMKTAVAAATEYISLKAQVDAGKKVDASAWILARAGMDKMSLIDAELEIVKLKLKGPKLAQAQAKLFGLQLKDTVRIANRNADRASASVLKMHKAGKRPAKGDPLTDFYYAMLLRGAETAEDSASYLAALPHARATLARQLKAAEKRVGELTGAGRRRAEAQRDSLKKDIAEVDAVAEDFRKAEAAKKEAARKKAPA